MSGGERRQLATCRQGTGRDSYLWPSDQSVDQEPDPHSLSLLHAEEEREDDEQTAIKILKPSDQIRS